MKFDILIIIRRHISSLRNYRSGRVDIVDLLSFYGLPIIISIVCVYYEVLIDRDTYNASLALYSIFAALLLNVQVAMFGIFQRGWRKPEDEKLVAIYEKSIEARRVLLEELNINVSYLIVVSCISISYFIMAYAMKLTGSMASGVSIFLYVHFVLTLFMVIKRAYALFDREYRQQ